MKIELRIAAVFLAAGAAFWAAGYGKAADKPAAAPAQPAPGAAAPARAGPDLDELPGIILDPSIGDWVLDRFAGNNKTGPLLYQGPAREIGGLGRIRQAVTTADGTVYVACATMGHCSLVVELVKVTPDGTLRLVMESNGLIEGPMGDCRAGRPIWNPKEKALYLTGPNCLRKVVAGPDGSRWVQVVAGTPNKAPGPRDTPKDGPARQATFRSFPRGIVCNSRGTFYWLESVPYGGRLRRIENGVVSTVPLKRPDNASRYFLNFAMGGAGCWLLSLGENDDTLYVSDYYGQDGYVVLKCDVNSGLLTRVCGIRPRDRAKWPPSLLKRHKRFLGETDGPALTHASGNSGMWGTYDAFHRALWIGCPDALRVRWLKLDGDGWVRTVMGAMRPQTQRRRYDDSGMGVPGEQFRFHYPAVIGFDANGGVFVTHAGNRTGLWRAYNQKEVKP
jgi:hypothetical protein